LLKRTKAYKIESPRKTEIVSRKCIYCNEEYRAIVENGTVLALCIRCNLFLLRPPISLPLDRFIELFKNKYPNFPDKKELIKLRVIESL